MHTALEATAIPQLQAHLRGEVICPGDARYERSRRVWNGRINRYPAMIVYCADPEDVLTTIDVARSVGLPITVRGGGHSMCGIPALVSLVPSFVSLVDKFSDIDASIISPLNGLLDAILFGAIFLISTKYSVTVCSPAFYVDLNRGYNYSG